MKNINNEYILDILENQDHTTVTILSSLLSVQDGIGFLPKNAIKVVADFVNVTTNDVWGVASYYLNFRFDPPGKNTIEILPVHDGSQWNRTYEFQDATYLEARVAEYGSVDKQLEYIVENGTAAFITKQEAIKAKYPKP